MGGNWRMPTYVEYKELLNNSTVIVSGGRDKINRLGKGFMQFYENDRLLTLPLAGYYSRKILSQWSSQFVPSNGITLNYYWTSTFSDGSNEDSFIFSVMQFLLNDASISIGGYGLHQSYENGAPTSLLPVRAVLDK